MKYSGIITTLFLGASLCTKQRNSDPKAVLLGQDDFIACKEVYYYN